jgi:hypothetical protein
MEIWGDTMPGAPARERCVHTLRWGFLLDGATAEEDWGIAASLRLNGESHEHKTAAVIQPRPRP